MDMQAALAIKTDELTYGKSTKSIISKPCENIFSTKSVSTTSKFQHFFCILTLVLNYYIARRP